MTETSEEHKKDALEFYELIEAMGYKEQRITALSNFIARRYYKVRSQSLLEAADDVQCLSSQLPNFDGHCYGEEDEPWICQSCLAAARLRGKANVGILEPDVPF